FVRDASGRGYLRLPNGRLVAHGSQASQGQLWTSDPAPKAAPGGGGGDTIAPVVSGMSPAQGAVIGASATFSATVTDNVGLRSVTFQVSNASGASQNFGASSQGNGQWTVNLQGFTNGSWSWRVIAKDTAKGGGNTTTSPSLGFTVDTSAGGGGGGGGGGGSVVANSGWNGGGTVQTAAGRIYFEMPTNARKTRWAGYVCSGTVAADATANRSIVITASHCVYDDAYKAFARNVLFIPNQDATGGSGTDLDCTNDPLGCWAPAFGVVDKNWTTRTFPDNVAWDYAYYVVNDAGAHSGTGAWTALDAATGTLAIDFGAPAVGASDASDYTHALGYSYSDDPNFMYCAQDMSALDAVNWWLASCELSGGASGGPWMQPVDGGEGPIISVNSWGYTTGPGMAGPKLSGTSASCLFGKAKTTAFGAVSTADGSEGVVVDPATCP
ncbi:MAG TPA: Ig-like domain-containing protein, partial [Nevskiaceae bacterium]|nr:Ig-like domain-containing protein [Nevskiaceae bacterium]